MSIYYYDIALKNKLQRWIKDPSIEITSPEDTRRLFERQLDKEDDSPIQLPLIALRRDPNINLTNTNKNSKTFDGAVVSANGDSVELLNVVPVSITYYLDIYCRYLLEADEYARNFIFNLINYPKVTVEIPYNNANIEHNSNISIIGDLVDNSDITERILPGQFTRYTLTLNISDAYLFSVPMKKPYNVESDVNVILQSSV